MKYYKRNPLSNEIKVEGNLNVIFLKTKIFKGIRRFNSNNIYVYSKHKMDENSKEISDFFLNPSLNLLVLFIKIEFLEIKF
jgi:hypothetical protein